MYYREITARQEKSDACHAITLTLPDWFGLPAANAMYRAEIVEKDVFGAFIGNTPVGLIALDYHFSQTAEIWWMGVCRSHHREGVGAHLMTLALQRARLRGCDYAVLMTLSPRSDDPGYAATRAFYTAQGFAPLVHIADGHPSNPMMWMIRAL